MWNTLKRAGKEGNTAERKTAERKAGDKRKITNEEKLDILVSAMLEYLEKQVTSLPEQGRFERHSVSMTYAGKIKFLGYGFYKGKKGFALRVHAKTKAKMKARVRELTSRRTVNDYEMWKIDLKRYVVGWVNYYKLADMGSNLQSIDEWMRRRIRMVFWKKWKRVRTRWRNLLKLGMKKLVELQKIGKWQVSTLRKNLQQTRYDGKCCCSTYNTPGKIYSHPPSKVMN